MHFTRILLVAIVSLCSISQINAQVTIKRQLLLPENWKCEQDNNFYKIKVDLDGTGKKSESVVHICFPKNGQQPSSKDISKYSCSYVNSIKITNWYIWAFGGDTALCESSDTSNDTDLRGYFSLGGFLSAAHSEATKLVAMQYRTNIITISSEDSKIFWKAFRKIAKNPVGRVLLYRILIELNRIIKKEGEDDTKKYNYVEDGCGVIEGKVVKMALNDINARNNCRSIDVKIITETSKSNFSWEDHAIALGAKSINLPVLKYDRNRVKTSMELSPLDVVLFHEMLHWFHFLRDPILYKKDKTDLFDYLVLSYYGDISELLVWGSVPELEVEEMKTILGKPDPNKEEEKQLICKDALRNKDFENKKFQEGDDLSENAYRISGEYGVRFGHTDALIPEFDPQEHQNFSKMRFQLAQKSAQIMADMAKHVVE